LYRELDKLNGEDEISAYEQRLTDRFGKIPEQSEELILAVKLRRLAVSLGMEKIKLRGEKLECFFISDQNSPFFQSSIFTNILALIQKFPQKAEMQQKNNKLSIIFFSIKTVKEALYALGKLKIYENDVTF
jgi:transcription-repair coupling factor (superfamily II helicase)